MSTRHRLTALIGGALSLLCIATVPVVAQNYPSAPVKFITQLGAGGGTDPAMRIVIDQLSRQWGQQAVLVNQPGAGGAIAARAVASAPPDGYTLFMAVASTFFALPELQPNLPFNVNDFVPVGFVGEVPLAIAVTPSLPVNSLGDLIAYSKKQTGGLSFAVPNPGGLTHLSIELLRERSHADLTFVFYPGSAQAMSDVISGRVPAIIDGLAGPVARGKLKLLSVTSPSHAASYPNVPAVAETFPGFAATGWFALVAPRGTPAPIVKKLSEDLHAALADPDVQKKFAALSMSTRSMSPDELGRFVQSEEKLWRPVLKRINDAAH